MDNQGGTLAMDALREILRKGMRLRKDEDLAIVVMDISTVWGERHGADAALMMLMSGWVEDELDRGAPYRELRGRLLAAVDVAMGVAKDLRKVKTEG